MKSSKHTFWVHMVRAVTFVVIGGVALTCISRVIHPSPKPYYAILAQTAALKTANIETKNGEHPNADHVGRVAK